MTPLYLSRKLCSKCGKPMTAVPDDVAPGRPRYVCLVSNAIRNCPLCVMKNGPHHRDYDLG